LLKTKISSQHFPFCHSRLRENDELTSIQLSDLICKFVGILQDKIPASSIRNAGVTLRSIASLREISSGASMFIEGGCLCGSVRYRINAEPKLMRLCWCRDCQYLAAGNATANVVFPSGAVTVTGELTDYVSKADSGNIMHRRFCPKCGTPVFSAAEIRPQVVIVRAGTLDDPSAIQPSMTIWTESAPTWACMNSSLPRFPRQPPPM
jgi:hypothetical protein